MSRVPSTLNSRIPLRAGKSLAVMLQIKQDDLIPLLAFKKFFVVFVVFDSR